MTHASEPNACDTRSTRMLHALNNINKTRSHACTRKANTHVCHEPMCVRSYQPCMQALHQGGYATTYVYVYVYVFLGNM